MEQKMIDADVTLDIRGTRCPIPSLKTMKMLASLESGQVMHVMTTDPNTKRSIPYLVQMSGFKQLRLLNDEDGAYHFFIKKA